MGAVINLFAATVSSALWQAVPEKKKPCIIQVVNQPSVSGFIESVTSFCFQLHTLYSLVCC